MCFFFPFFLFNIINYVFWRMPAAIHHKLRKIEMKMVVFIAVFLISVWMKCASSFIIKQQQLWNYFRLIGNIVRRTVWCPDEWIWHGNQWRKANFWRKCNFIERANRKKSTVRRSSVQITLSICMNERWNVDSIILSVIVLIAVESSRLPRAKSREQL